MSDSNVGGAIFDSTAAGISGTGNTVSVECDDSIYNYCRLLGKDFFWHVSTEELDEEEYEEEQYEDLLLALDDVGTVEDLSEEEGLTLEVEFEEEHDWSLLEGMRFAVGWGKSRHAAGTFLEASHYKGNVQVGVNIDDSSIEFEPPPTPFGHKRVKYNRRLMRSRGEVDSEQDVESTEESSSDNMYYMRRERGDIETSEEGGMWPYYTKVVDPVIRPGDPDDDSKPNSPHRILDASDVGKMPRVEANRPPADNPTTIPMSGTVDWGGFSPSSDPEDGDNIIFKWREAGQQEWNEEPQSVNDGGSISETLECAPWDGGDGDYDGIVPGTWYEMKIVAKWGDYSWDTETRRVKLPPEVLTLEAEDVTEESATLNGVIRYGETNTSNMYFEVGGPGGVQRIDISASDVEGNGKTSQEIDYNNSLRPGEDYSFRTAVEYGTTGKTGDTRTFTTPEPDIQTLSAGSVHESQMTLRGSINVDGDIDSWDWYFEVYDEESGEWEKESVSSRDQDGIFEKVIRNLEIGGSYKHRAVAEWQNGDYRLEGTQQEQQTASPSITGAEVTDVTEQAATVSGILSTESPSTEWDLEAHLWNRTETVPLDSEGHFETRISGLVPGASYTLEFVANHAGGKSDVAGELDIDVRTPTVRTEGTEDVESYGAYLKGTFSAESSRTDWTPGFIWWNSDPDSSEGGTLSAGSIAGDGTFRAWVGGLDEDETYTFRARVYHDNSNYVKHGSENSFTTEEDDG